MSEKEERYSDKTTDIDPHRYMMNLKAVIKKLTAAFYLEEVGKSIKEAPLFNQCYYSIIEMTNAQKSNAFCLAKALGFQYLRFKYKPYIVRIEGKYPSGESGTGSGVLFGENTILTCGHNIDDLKEISCWIGESELKISEVISRGKYDIGIIKLAQGLDYKVYPYFGAAYVLDETLTLGYPPLNGMSEAPLIAQSGEINAISKDWYDYDCITISSITRPGNSGGPVVSKNGCIVGIVTQKANFANYVSVDKNYFCEKETQPFYNAIATNEIIRIVSEMDESIEIVYEDYQ